MLFGKAALRPGKKWIIGAIAAVFLLPLSGSLLLLVLLSNGHGAGFVARSASQWLRRDIQFARLDMRLSSGRYDVRIHDLVIDNPRWIPSGNLAEARQLTLRFGGISRLLSLRPDEIEIDHLSLHLIRFAPGRNNWAMSSGKVGPAFAPLRPVSRFRVTGGTIDFRDFNRDLFLRGRFTHDSVLHPAFALDATGVLKKGPITVRGIGGALNADAVGRPYPFTLDLKDGATFIHATGTSGDAFNLTSYALDVHARGPNLADIGYLFNLITPNTAPFHATVHASSDGAHLAFDKLDLHADGSHVTGRIWSDHSGPRREIRATFDAPVLTRSDISALLAPIPARSIAATRSGAVPAGPRSPWILTDTPISLRRMRGADFDFTIHIGRLTGYPLPLTNIRTRTDLDRGLLDFPAFRADLYGGELTGSASVDASVDRPQFRVRGSLARLDLSRATAMPQAGQLSGSLDLAGTGASLHQAAANARGKVSVRLDHATLPDRAAWMLGGDLLRAALSGKRGVTALECMTADLVGRNGRLELRNFGLTTRLGTASATGYADLGTESLQMILQGTPARRRLFQVAAPVQIAGPWLSPTITPLPGRKAQALGLHGTLGVVLTPLAGLLPIGKGIKAEDQPKCKGN